MALFPPSPPSPCVRSIVYVCTGAGTGAHVRMYVCMYVSVCTGCYWLLLATADYHPWLPTGYPLGYPRRLVNVNSRPSSPIPLPIPLPHHWSQHAGELDCRT
jgi:hypothetical protein